MKIFENFGGKFLFQKNQKKMTHFRSVAKEDNSLTRIRKGMHFFILLILTESKSDKQEIGGQAVWSLSSAKPGFGVAQLRDDNLETYWQYLFIRCPFDSN
jgi:hypothetical protein